MYLRARMQAPADAYDLDRLELEQYDEGEPLTAYISGYDHRSEQNQSDFKRLLDNIPGARQIHDPETPSAYLKPGPPATAEIVVAYWRKANAIHQWFVDNVQDGNDDCDEYECSREQLLTLRQRAQQVLDSIELVEGELTNGFRYDENGTMTPIKQRGLVVAEPCLAQELLPTTSGFFFGSVEYNEWYVHELRATVEQIERALQAPEDTVFVYQSSW